MGVTYGITKNSKLNVYIRKGYTLHTNHVCKRQNEGCVQNMQQNPDPARVVYLFLCQREYHEYSFKKRLGVCSVLHSMFEQATALHFTT